MKPFVRGISALAGLALAIPIAAASLAGQPTGRPADTRGTDANITRVATDILARSQFSHHPLDADLAGRFLDRYLDALDGTRSLFLQSDVDEFAHYRATLARATAATGDTGAARAIFARYLQRLGQQVAFDKGILRTSPFDFTGHDVYNFDREHAVRPANVTAAHGIWRQQLRVEYLQEKLADKRPDQIVSALARRHEQQLSTMKGLGDDEVLEIYLDALAHVYDPHSDYLGHEQMESLSIAMNLSLFGIGASLEMEDGYCRVHELLPGGPAARGDLLKPGDRIIAVAQGGKAPVDIVNMPLSRAVEMIRGPKGSSVTLTVLPRGGAESSLPKTVSLVRDAIRLADQEAKARIVDVPVQDGKTLRLGVIDLPSFYADMGDGPAGVHRSATKDVARLLEKLKRENVQGIVMDLRSNGGGSLDEAISLTGLFIRKGPVVQTRDPSGRIEVGTDDDGKVFYDGPLVLFTSRFSASATEIMTGALQDYGRAVIVGDSSTFGKGTVQTILRLAPLMDRAGLAYTFDPGALKVTISKFYRPSGVSTQLRGVASDIVLPSTTDFSDVNESTLKDPLPWDVVPSASFERLNRVQPFLGSLRARSARRVEQERDFAYLAGNIERLGKNLASKSVSLNEGERRQELAQEKARRADRRRQTFALDTNEPRVFDITLENADAPGLPAPNTRAKNDARNNTKNAAFAGAPTATDDQADAAADRDVILRESEQILADYIDLLDHPADTGSLRRAAR